MYYSDNNNKQIESSSNSNHKSANPKIKILKSYYNKDASASVTRSFLSIDENHYQAQAKAIKNQNTFNTVKNSESLSSLSSPSYASSSTSSSTTSSTQKNNSNENDSALNSLIKTSTEQELTRKNSLLNKTLTNVVDANSCTSFVNQLVDDTIKKLDKVNEFSTGASSSKTLPLNKKKKASLIKRFSIKSNKTNNIEHFEQQNNLDSVDCEQPCETNLDRKNSKDLLQIGVKLISKILIATNQANSNSSLNNSVDTKSQKSSLSSISNINLSQSHSFPTNFDQTSNKTNSNNNNSNLLNKSLDDLDKQSVSNCKQMYQYSNKTYSKPLYLLSKKLRKLLPLNYGLKNHGNTCFMNCVLQSLFHTSPLADFFVTNQYEHDIQAINAQRQQQLLQTPHTNKSLPPFILTKHFHRLLLSMWQNGYDSTYSAELKQLIGYLNPTFAGVNQNDSHEFCVWLLDRLSQELTYRLLNKQNNRRIEEEEDEEHEDRKSPMTSSFIEELFKVEFKSTVICSKCNYKSSKYETDMMLSLPLPQYQSNSFRAKNVITNLNQSQFQKQYLRRSLYVNLILTNQKCIKQFTLSTSTSSSSSSPSSTSSYNSSDLHMSKSKFYLSEINTDLTNESITAPFNVKIGVNIHVTNDNLFLREIVNLNENNNLNQTVINPDLNDLRKYIENAYGLNTSNLIFMDTAQVKSILYDNYSLKELFLKSSMTDDYISRTSNSFCVLELNQLNQQRDQMPMINIIATNVYVESSNKRTVCFGLPFVVLINRDCTYSELCRKLLEAQSKFFKDKNILKYKDLAEKFFTVSLVSSFSKQEIRINSTDELPLYAECIDKALNESSRLSQNITVIEHIRINIEWRSYEDISSFVKDTDFTRADLVHNTVKQLQKLDESEEVNRISNGSNYSNPTTFEKNSSNLTTLNDCFELFTQCEELSDDNSWTCTKCKKQTNAYKKLSINTVPPILIIHLKRFFYKSKTSNFKLTTPVWFPVDNLDMSKYLSNKQLSADENEYSNEDYTDSSSDQSSSSNKQYIYDLFAVCNHKGQNMANGHYTAYCKNPIDTKWYCFDDSNCIPLHDPNVMNTIFNNGSGNICTENAYILFYKRRNCMRNEKWWINYVDRSLLDYDEFEYYLRNLDQIEKQQHEYQNQQQIKFLQNQKTTRNTTTNGYNTIGKKSNGIKSFKEKIIGSGNRSQTEMSSTIINFDLDQTGDSNSNSRSNYLDLESSNYDIITPVNCYDELNKPKRLIKREMSREFSPSVNTPLTSSPTKQNSNSPSTPSSSSKALSNNTLSNIATSSPSTHPSSKSSSIVKMNSDGNLINFTDSGLSNDLIQQLNLKEDVDFLLNYPNDNEFIYHQQQHYYNPNTVVHNQAIYGHMIPYQQKQFVYQQNPVQHLNGISNNFIYANNLVYHKRGVQAQSSSQRQQINMNTNSLSKNSSNANTSSGTNSSNRYINPSSIETPI